MPLESSHNSIKKQLHSSRWLMPHEGQPHQRTWMAFGASKTIWGARLLPEVRRDLATIAQAIAQYEPVSMLVRKEEHDLAARLMGQEVELIDCAIDDLWMRDTGPIFVTAATGHQAAIDFNFNGWGGKQAHVQDAKVANFVAAQAAVPSLATDLVLEGGCIEVDGEGTAIISESCVLNSNRNPGLSRLEFEKIVKPLLGIQKVIWLPGIKGLDITDGHTDFYARFAAPSLVLAHYDRDPQSVDQPITKEHLKILNKASDAHGRSLQVIPLEAPSNIPQYEADDFAAGYLGFYICNNAVLMQEFGDKQADREAQQLIQQAFPDRQVVSIRSDAIATGGGSIHCTTQQQILSQAL